MGQCLQRRETWRHVWCKRTPHAHCCPVLEDLRPGEAGKVLIRFVERLRQAQRWRTRREWNFHSDAMFVSDLHDADCRWHYAIIWKISRFWANESGNTQAPMERSYGSVWKAVFPAWLPNFARVCTRFTNITNTRARGSFRSSIVALWQVWSIWQAENWRAILSHLHLEAADAVAYSHEKWARSQRAGKRDPIVADPGSNLHYSVWVWRRVSVLYKHHRVRHRSMPKR